MHAAGVEVEVVRRAGAAGLQELAHREDRRPVDRLPVDLLPDLVEVDQPVEELCVLHGGEIARERLEEVVVRVDEPRHDHVVRAVDHPRARRVGDSAADPRDRSAVDEDIGAAQAVGVGRRLDVETVLQEQRAHGPPFRVIRIRLVPSRCGICRPEPMFVS